MSCSRHWSLMRLASVRLWVPLAGYGNDKTLLARQGNHHAPQSAAGHLVDEWHRPLRSASHEHLTCLCLPQHARTSEKYGVDGNGRLRFRSIASLSFFSPIPQVNPSIASVKLVGCPSAFAPRGPSTPLLEAGRQAGKVEQTIGEST